MLKVLKVRPHSNTYTDTRRLCTPKSIAVLPPLPLPNLYDRDRPASPRGPPLRLAKMSHPQLEKKS